MEKAILLSIFGLLALTSLYSLVSAKILLKKHTGSKKIADAAKDIETLIRDEYKTKIYSFSMVAIVLFTAIIYTFGWQAAVCFLASAVLIPIIDYFLLNFSISSTPRIVEMMRAKEKNFQSTILNSSFSSIAILTSLVVVLGLLVQLIFNGSATILSFALGTIFASIYAWRSSKTMLVSVSAVTIALCDIYFPKFLSGNTTAALIPAAIFSTGLIFSFVSLKLGHLISSKGKEKIAQYLEPIVFFLLSSAIFIFLFWSTNNRDFNQMLWPSAAYLAGVLIAIFSIYLTKLKIIVPAIAVVLVVIASDSFSGISGIAYATLGFSSLSVPVAIYNLIRFQIKNVVAVANEAEIPSEFLAETNKIKSKNYLTAICAMFGFGFLAYYTMQTNANLTLNDPKLIAGLLLGGIGAYLANSEIVKSKLFLSVASLVAVVATGVILGPVYLAGAVAGAILLNLFVGQSANMEILSVAIITVLISALVENPFSLLVRSIIAGSILIIFAVYLFTLKFYGRRTE